MALIRWFFQLFWVGGCALAMLWQTRLLFGVTSLPGWLDGFVFGATVFGYNFAAAPWRRWPARAIGLAAALCFLQLPGTQQLTTLAPASIWLLYYGLHRPGRPGLRKFPALKPMAIALAWAWVTVLSPLRPVQWTDAAWLFVGRSAFIFALALAYDLCDQPSDIRHNLRTLVIQLGAKRSLRLIDAALFLSACCCCLNWMLGYYAGATTLALLASLAASAFAIRRLAPQIDLGFWRKVGIDGLMVVQLGMVWVSLCN